MRGQKSELYSSCPGSLSKESETEALAPAPTPWVIQTPCVSALRSSQIGGLATLSFAQTFMGVGRILHRSIHLHVGKEVISLRQALASITEEPRGCGSEVSGFIPGPQGICLQGLRCWAAPRPPQSWAPTSTQARDLPRSILLAHKHTITSSKPFPFHDWEEQLPESRSCDMNWT